MRYARAGLNTPRIIASHGSRIAEPARSHLESSANSDWASPVLAPPAEAMALPNQMPEFKFTDKESPAVLIAEDNFANQLVTKTLLLRAGYRVTTVDDGAQALQICNKTQFDIVLMDIEMPQMSGLEAADHIRKSGGPNTDTLIIALTAHGSATERFVYRSSGINFYLPKPFKIAQMETLLGLTPGPDIFTTKAASANSKALLDEETLLPLIEAAGDIGLSGIVKAYWRSAYALLADMQEANQVFDRNRLKKSAHALKGASINIGLPALAKMSVRLQNAKPESVPPILEDLETLMAKSRKALAARLS